MLGQLMLRLRPRAQSATSRRHPGERAGDEGFSLIEVLVSIGVVSVVMAALTMFFVSVLTSMNQQRGKQTAVRLADDGIERVRAVKASEVLSGRDRSTTAEQWAAPATVVAPYLTDLQQAWDSKAAYPSGRTATLPTVAEPITIDGVAYQRHWYVGRCWQPVGGGACGPTETAGGVPLLRVITAVTWPDNHCTASVCGYVTSTLVSDASTEPIFNTGATAEGPVVANPGDQTGELTVAANLQFSADGGAPPLTWSASGLPPGLTMDSSGLVSGTPTTAGTYAVVATATDGFKLTGTAAFDWTINELPKPTGPGDQVSGLNSTVNLPIARTGGTTPVTWSVTAPGDWGATGLPPGLSIDTASGVISGSPTTTGTAKPVTVKVTDRYGKSATTTFTWAVTAPKLDPPTATTSTAGSSITPVQLSATGGTSPYTFSAQNLPPGLSITSGGLISGTPTRGTRYVVDLTVTDKAGVTDTATVVWNVNAAAGGLAVSAPTGDRTTSVGQSVSFTAQATGGSGSGYTWSATGLPPGLTVSSGGAVSGQPTKAGTHVVTLTVRDSAGKVADLMFTWTIS